MDCPKQKPSSYWSAPVCGNPHVFWCFPLMFTLKWMIYNGKSHLETNDLGNLHICFPRVQTRCFNVSAGKLLCTEASILSIDSLYVEDLDGKKWLVEPVVNVYRTMENYHFLGGKSTNYINFRAVWSSYVNVYSRGSCWRTANVSHHCFTHVWWMKWVVLYRKTRTNLWWELYLKVTWVYWEPSLVTSDCSHRPRLLVYCRSLYSSYTHLYRQARIYH